MKPSDKPSPGLLHLLTSVDIPLRWLISGLVLFVIFSLLVLSPYVLVVYNMHILIAGGGKLTQELYSNIRQASITVAGITLLLFICAYIGGMCCQYSAMLLTRALRLRTARRLSSLTSQSNNHYSSIELRRILHDDLDTVTDFIGQQIPELVKAIAVPVLILAVLTFFDWRLALTCALPIPVLLLLIPYSAKRKKQHNLREGFFNTRTAMDASMSEFITALPVIRNFGLTVSSFHSYSQRVHAFRQFMHLWINTMVPHWSRFFSFLSNASLPMLALGLWLYIHNGIDLNVLLLFMLLGSAAFRPLFALANTSSQLAIIRDIDTRMQSVLGNDTKHESDTQLKPSDNEMTLHNVSFSYGDQPVLHHISACIAAGQCTALVGPSGSGKTTLARLLAGLLQPSQGDIQLGGASLSRLSAEHIQQRIAFAFQDAILFGMSIRDNIQLGMELSDSKVIEAASTARCHQFITELPFGYDTIIGEHITTLSGGQKQRIQLARAIAKQAPVVILDEATAFADAENEAHIQQALSALAQCQSLVVISHRLHTIIHADQILVMDKGNIIATGRHEQLLVDCALYQQLWHRQQASVRWQVRAG